MVLILKKITVIRWFKSSTDFLLGLYEVIDAFDNLYEFMDAMEVFGVRSSSFLSPMLYG